jgi:hypothetical protein
MRRQLDPHSKDPSGSRVPFKMENLSFSTSGTVPITSQELVVLVSTISTIIYVLAVLYFMRRLADGKGNHIPNGPVGLPIIGNSLFRVRAGSPTNCSN